MRFCIELSYLGTDFAGWQNQLNAVGVQELIEKGLSTLLKQKIEIVGSSRTDAGVHAVQQFAHFDFYEKFDASDIRYRLNQILPFSIAIKEIRKVSDSFHARFDAKSRAYEYRISQFKNPFLTHQAYLLTTKLDVDIMNEACKILFKHIDFQAFSKTHTDVTTFNCAILRAEWLFENKQLVFHIKANRFLRGMVRAIVGTMLEVGLGKINLEQFEAVILSKNRKNAGFSVPAKGLFLTEVNY
jgi:tRNA pseudouridine38-40 synthase